MQIPTSITSINYLSATFWFPGTSSETISSTQTVTLDSNVAVYTSSRDELSMEVALESGSNYNILIFKYVVKGEFGTTNLTRYLNNREYKITTTSEISGLTSNISLTLSDSWGPVLFYFRRNGNAHISTPTITTDTISGVTVEIYDYNDYYQCLYKYTSYSNTYSNYPYVEHNLTYSGHYRAGWGLGLVSEGTIYFTGDMDWPGGSLPVYEDSSDIRYIGAIWGETACPKIYTSDSAYDEKKALMMRVLTANGWVAPQAVYVYDGSNWVRAQNSG